jgi:hypothetical protein
VTDNLVEARRQHLTVEVERCRACGEASAGDACVVRILRYLCDDVGVIDTLNDILVECCKLRGCYPLMHRTLHEFNWFCNCAIGGAGPFIDGEIATAEADGDEALAGALRDRRNEENGIRDRFGERYSYGSDELIRLAEAFLIYCREQYGDEEVEA